ncbi:MAG: hypothetical protein JPMHGGIA_00983 [Saprospiraceae bacterium]|nr:hypothetical protein [Saprospiraceae bacterium]
MLEKKQHFQNKVALINMRSIKNVLFSSMSPILNIKYDPPDDPYSVRDISKLNLKCPSINHYVILILKILKFYSYLIIVLIQFYKIRLAQILKITHIYIYKACSEYGRALHIY